MTAGVVAASRNNNLFGSVDFTGASNTNLKQTNAHFGALASTKKIAVCFNLLRKAAGDFNFMSIYNGALEMSVQSLEMTTHFYTDGTTHYNMVTNGLGITSTTIFNQILVLIDTTQASAANRFIVYKNGSVVALTATVGIPQNADLYNDGVADCYVGQGEGGYANGYFNQFAIFSNTIPAITDTWDSTGARPKDITPLPGKHCFLRCPAQNYAYDDVLATSWGSDVAPAWSVRTALT